MELESLVCQVKELLPELGEGFVTDCLQYYNLDPDKVVNAIMEDNLPEILSNMDQSSSLSLYVQNHSQLELKEQSRKNDGVHISIGEDLNRSYSNNVSRKLELRSPMNLFFTKVKDSLETHKDEKSLHITDLFHPSLGSLESSLQINFMVEYEWLMMNYELTNNEDKPLTIIYGEDNRELAINNGQPRRNVTTKRVKPRYPFGTHHTKMMILAYEDQSIRVVVHTANLISSDWENRTQGIWVSPRCPPLETSNYKDEKAKQSGDSETRFKECLLNYLEYYEVSALRPYINKIKACNFSTIKAFFVGSVPGSHVINRTDPSKNWGHAFVGKMLTKHNDHYKETGYNDEDTTIILQSSSIGSMGASLDNSFVIELATSLNALASRSSKQRPKHVKVVYPTKNSVFNAYGGLLYGGGCLPYSRSTSLKQPWLKELMCKWKSENIKRTRAMPHIKTFTKIRCVREESDSDQTKYHASYFLLTSANLSKAAWGTLNKTEDKIFIQSYEAGILLLPKFTHEKSKCSYTVSLKGNFEHGDLVLPYDLPLSDYDPNDEPWVLTGTMEYLTDLL